MNARSVADGFSECQGSSDFESDYCSISTLEVEVRRADLTSRLLMKLLDGHGVLVKSSRGCGEALGVLTDDHETLIDTNGGVAVEEGDVIVHDEVLCLVGRQRAQA